MRTLRTILLGILFCVAATQAQARALPEDSLAQKPMTKADSIVAFAKQHLGKPYKYANCGPDAFDCSGFVSYVFAHFNITLPRSSRDYMTQGKEVPLSECRKGDVILFTGTHAGETRVGHVGIIVSEPGQPVQFIHASSSTNHPGVVITNYLDSAYPKRFVKVIRVL